MGETKAKRRNQSDRNAEYRHRCEQTIASIYGRARKNMSTHAQVMQWENTEYRSTRAYAKLSIADREYLRGYSHALFNNLYARDLTFCYLLGGTWISAYALTSEQTREVASWPSDDRLNSRGKHCWTNPDGAFIPFS